MKALTVRQPWAWAIIHGGKNIENRTQAWSYRGPLAIHAGAQLSSRGAKVVPQIMSAQRGDDGFGLYLGDNLFSAIVGVVDLVDIHPAMPDCCDSVWAEHEYIEASGKTRRQLVHLELANPRHVQAIPCTGRLGLWTPPADVLEQLGSVT